MRRLILIATLAGLLVGCSTTKPIPDNDVSMPGYYEINENGFNVWCYGEGDCETPPKDAQLNALYKMCIVYGTYEHQP